MTQPTNFQIRKFPIQSMKHDATVLILGPRRTGKSVLLRYLLYKLNLKKKFHAGWIMGGSLDARNDIKDLVPESFNLEFTVPEFKRRIDQITKLEDVIKQQDLSILTCYDDCTYDKTFLKCKETRNIAMNGRHYNMTDIKCMQYAMDMPPDVRSQMDYVFVTKQSRRDVMVKIWKYFFGCFSKYDEFEQVLTACTNDHEVLVFDGTVASNKIEDCVFYFKADLNIPKFKLFAPEYWILDRYYRSLVNRKRNKEIQESAGLLVASASCDAKTKQRKTLNASDPQEIAKRNTRIRGKLNEHLDDQLGDLEPELCVDDSEARDDMFHKDLQKSVTKSIKISKN